MCEQKTVPHPSLLLPGYLAPSFYWWSRLENLSNALCHLPLWFGSLLVRLHASNKQTYFVFSTACRVLYMCLYYKTKRKCKNGLFQTFIKQRTIFVNNML